MLLMFIRRHKLEQAAAVNLFRLVNQILQYGDSKLKIPPYQEVRTFVERFGITKIEKIDCCPNDHILFRGVNSELAACPICREPRRIDGCPQKQFIYLGVQNQLRDRFRRHDWALISKLKPFQDSDILSDVSTGSAWKRLSELEDGTFFRCFFPPSCFQE